MCQTVCHKITWDEIQLSKHLFLKGVDVIQGEPQSKIAQKPQVAQQSTRCLLIDFDLAEKDLLSVPKIAMQHGTPWGKGQRIIGFYSPGISKNRVCSAFVEWVNVELMPAWAMVPTSIFLGQKPKYRKNQRLWLEVAFTESVSSWT
jgi:hypothetical protein